MARPPPSAATSTERRRIAPAQPRKAPTLELVRKANWAIDKVTEDIDGRFAFNTAIAAVMELVNELYRLRAEVEAGTLRFALATRPR